MNVILKVRNKCFHVKIVYELSINVGASNSCLSTAVDTGRVCADCELWSSRDSYEDKVYHEWLEGNYTSSSEGYSAVTKINSADHVWLLERVIYILLLTYRSRSVRFVPCTDSDQGINHIIFCSAKALIWCLPGWLKIKVKVLRLTAAIRRTVNLR